MLSDKRIIEEMQNGNIVIEPFDERQLGTNSYDCRLGEWYFRGDYSVKSMRIDDPEQVHVNVVHYQPAEQQAVLAAKSGQQDAETIEASVDAPRGSQDTIPCLSIRQPWAWLIANGFKNIENRDWTTGYRGPVLIHAGKAVDNDCFIGKEINFDFFEQFGDEVVDALPRYKSDYALGCIVGQANLVDVVEDSDSQWFCGTYGFVMENAQTINPIPYPGKLKLFNVPKDVISNQSAEQEAVLAAKTDELPIETTECSDD